VDGKKKSFPMSLKKRTSAQSAANPSIFPNVGWTVRPDPLVCRYASMPKIKTMKRAFPMVRTIGGPFWCGGVSRLLDDDRDDFISAVLICRIWTYSMFKTKVVPADLDLE
jgi:hypothetical protein